jgi:hypothetical protein
LPINLLQENEIFFEELADRGKRLDPRIVKLMGRTFHTVNKAPVCHGEHLSMVRQQVCNNAVEKLGLGRQRARRRAVKG